MRVFYDSLLKAEAILAAVLLLGMVFLIFGAGVGRMAHYPVNWTIDMATCFFAWACFLCGDIAWRNDTLMSVDILVKRVPERLRRLMIYVNYAIILAFLAYLIHSGFRLSWISRARSFQGIPEVSYSWVTMSLPVGGCLLMITTIRKIAAKLREDFSPAGHDASGE